MYVPMLHRATQRVPLLAGLLVVLLAVAACSTTVPPPSQGLSLEGTWLVEPFEGTVYGAGGTTTLTFGADASGSAQFLSRADANDVTTCERHVYAVLSQDVVLLDDEYYVVDAVDANTVVLDNQTDGMTLTRIAGAPPVDRCQVATVTQLASYSEGIGGFSNLSAVGDRLYFNIDDTDDSIASYDVTSDTFGAPRTYSQSVSGGVHRWVVAARSDDLFYGHCGCGGSGSVDAFDLSTDTSIVSVETTDLGNEISVRYGYFDAGAVTIGGRSRDTAGVNVLLTLDPDTLALVSERQILPEATVDDVTLVDGQLLALVNGDLVVVSIDGSAEATISLDGLGSYPMGLASIGTAVYVVADPTADEAGIYEVNLP